MYHSAYTGPGRDGAQEGGTAPVAGKAQKQEESSRAKHPWVSRGSGMENRAAGCSVCPTGKTRRSPGFRTLGGSASWNSAPAKPQ